jgi:hypothetical protein
MHDTAYPRPHEVVGPSCLDFHLDSMNERQLREMCLGLADVVGGSFDRGPEIIAELFQVETKFCKFREKLFNKFDQLSLDNTEDNIKLAGEIGDMLEDDFNELLDELGGIE